MLIRMTKTIQTRLAVPAGIALALFAGSAIASPEDTTSKRAIVVAGTAATDKAELTQARTVAEATELWESPDWNQAELTVLFSAAVEVNSRRVTLDLGKDSSGTAPTAPKSPGAATTASLTASS